MNYGCKICYMYWRHSIHLFGGLKYNRTSTGKDYLSYRKNGIYIREPIADLKKDLRNVFHRGNKKIDVDEFKKKIKDSFETYNDVEIFNQIELLRQLNVSDDDIADFVGSAIFDGTAFSIDQLNHAKDIFLQIKCSKSKKKEIENFICNEINQITMPQSNNQRQLPSQSLLPSNNKNNQTIPSTDLKNSTNGILRVFVEIFREEKGQYNKVSSGQCEINNGSVIISANVTKSFEINNIIEIYKKSNKLFIYVKTRKQPFILASTDIDDLLDAISNQFSKNQD